MEVGWVSVSRCFANFVCFKLYLTFFPRVEGRNRDFARSRKVVVRYEGKKNQGKERSKQREQVDLRLRSSRRETETKHEEKERQRGQKH